MHTTKRTRTAGLALAGALLGLAAPALTAAAATPGPLFPVAPPTGQAGLDRSVSPMFTCVEGSGITEGLSRSEILARAKKWVDLHIPYSQSDCNSDYDGRKYRTDCSGFVSMAWGLTTSYATPDFFSDSRGPWTTISWSDLQPGDAVVRDGHIVLFVSWTDSTKTRFNDYEEMDTDHGTIAYTRSVATSKSDGYHPIRYDKIRPDVVEGDFVQVAGTDPVYRIAGGAPLYVSSWAKVSDVASHPVKTVSQATFNALPRYPKDGTFLSDGDGDGAWRIAGGAPLKISNWAKFPAGSALKAIDVDDLNITSAGTGMYTHTRTVPLNGTFLGDSTTTAAYITVGGAPMRIYDWADYPAGSALKAVEIDPVNITSAGTAGIGLLKYPANGSFIGDVHSLAAYRIAGGAPLQLNDWNTYTDAQKASAVEVDTRNFTGTNLRPYPADGTMISDKDSSRAWVVAGGAAITLFDWAPYSAAQKASTVEIDTYALDIAGTPGSHLRATPANGTFLSAVTPTTNARKTFRIIGGAPLYVASTTPYGTPKVITVNEAAVLNAGTTTVPTLTLYPANGTLLQTTTGTKYQISNGRALPYTGTTTIPTTNTIDTATITNAGGAYPYNHLAK
ncbi:MAG: hypothetical protein U0Q15_05450 [Kineosporiaceae bacterium]